MVYNTVPNRNGFFRAGSTCRTYKITRLQDLLYLILWILYMHCQAWLKRPHFVIIISRRKGQSEKG